MWKPSLSYGMQILGVFFLNFYLFLGVVCTKNGYLPTHLHIYYFEMCKESNKVYRISNSVVVHSPKNTPSWMDDA
jgi:hypothetical protein